MLDPQLNFSLQADFAVSKVKRAAAKVSLLYDGREGIPLQTGINLYKTLIRPHLEYAVPVWAAMSDNFCWSLWPFSIFWSGRSRRTCEIDLIIFTYLQEVVMLC